jgi:hypothetical protein
VIRDGATLRESCLVKMLIPSAGSRAGTRSLFCAEFGLTRLRQRWSLTASRTGSFLMRNRRRWSTSRRNLRRRRLRCHVPCPLSGHAAWHGWLRQQRHASRVLGVHCSLEGDRYGREAVREKKRPSGSGAILNPVGVFCATTREKTIFAVDRVLITVISECMLQFVSTGDDRNAPYSFGIGRDGVTTRP